MFDSSFSLIPKPRTAVWAAFAVLLVAGLVAEANGQEASVTVQSEDAQNGLAGMVGPHVGLYGPPTAFSFQLHYWHAFDERLGFYSVAALDVGGETTLEGESSADDATYASTVGGQFFAGMRYVIELAQLPFETYTRAGALVSVTGGEEVVGYSVGIAGAAGLAYAISPDVELIAETVLGFGLGQYKAAGVVPATTLDVLVGAQVRF